MSERASFLSRFVKEELSDRQKTNGALAGFRDLFFFAAAAGCVFAAFFQLHSLGVLPNTMLGNPNQLLTSSRLGLYLGAVWFFLLLVFAAPPAWKRSLVLFASFCTLAILLPLWIIGVLALYGFVLYYVVHAKIPASFKWTILILLWCGFYFGYLGWLDPVVEKKGLEGFAVVLFAAFFLKDVYYLFEKTTVYRRRVDKHPLRNFYIFFMASPFFFNVYHIKPIGYTYFHDKFLDRPQARVVRDGVLLFALGICYLLLHAHVFSLWYDWPGFGGKLLITDHYMSIPNWHVLLFIYYNFFKVFLVLAGNVYLIVGIVRMFGFDIKADFHYPFFAKNLLEHWRRWNIYNRDFVVALIFNPIVFTLGRKVNKYLTFFVACMFTFLAGLGVLVHLITTTFYVGEARFMVGILSRTLLLGLATSINIWIDLWMSKKKRKKRLEAWYAKRKVLGTLRLGLKILATVTLVGSIYLMQQGLAAGLSLAQVGRILLAVII